MSLRDKLNENPSITTGVTIAIIVVVLGYILYSSMGRGPSGGPPPMGELAFYTVDDGATWFADDANKLPPFDHNGKQAVRARVYKCDGKTFVNHMEQYTPAALKRLEQAKARNPEGSNVIAAESGGVEVKSPGDAKWVNANDRAAAAIVRPKCKGDVELVLP